MAVSILVTFQVTFLVLREKYQRTLDGMRLAESDLAKLSQVQSLFEREYVGEVNKTAVLDALLKSYVRAAGDKYSEYYTAEEYEALQSVQRGEAVGIGVIVTEDETGIRVQWVSEGSPAEKAGVQMGDLIVAVDGKGKETDSYETMVDAVRGEIGSEVVLDIRRPAEGGEEPVVLKVTRAEYTSSSVTYRLLQDGKTGYIRILTFDGTTAKQFLSAVELLQKQGADRMVFDLRGNGGGLLTSVVEILDALLPEGTIVTTRDAAGEEKVYSSDEKELCFPMAVLCNGSTASAAELFTAALRDYKKATLVGETTYGKGVAQNTFRLGDGSAVKLTTSYYDPPSGVNYDGVGITPDVLVTVPEGYTVAGQYSLNESEDAQLQAAVAALTDGGEP